MQLLTLKSNNMTPEIILKIITEFPDATFESKIKTKFEIMISPLLVCPQGTNGGLQIRKKP